jgi:hypothetical protein
MGIKSGVGNFIRKAKDEAGDLAQSARIKIDMRSLEGRRDHLFEKVGRKVYADRGAMTFDLAAIEPLLTEIGAVLEEIKAKEAELRSLRQDGAAEVEPTL